MSNLVSVGTDPQGEVSTAKGSRNKVTVLKLIAEQSARERNAGKLQEVVDRIIDLALVGDATAMQLVWKSVMSNGAADTTSAAAEKVSININAAAAPAAPPPQPAVIEVVQTREEEVKAPGPIKEAVEARLVAERKERSVPLSEVIGEVLTPVHRDDNEKEVIQ